MNVAIARRQILHRSAGHIHHEQMRTSFGLPFRPVTVQQRRVTVGFDFVILLGLQTALVAIVARTIGKHLAGENQFPAVGRKHDATSLGGETGDLPHNGAVRVHDPHLCRPAAIER